ncbi:hypothetical protein KI387_044608, partial [Taxus chinensis]
DHRAKVDYKNKVIECQDDLGSAVVISGMQRPISLHMISAHQRKWSMHKGCLLFAIIITDRSKGIPKNSPLDDHAVLREYVDVFL